jgi:hypothetical protein
MGGVVRSVWAWVRNLDAAVSRRTADGTSFDAAMRRAVTNVHTWTATAASAIGSRVPESLRDALGPGAARARTFDVVGRDPTGLVGAAAVFVVAYVVTRLFWTPLSWPASIVNSVVASATPTSCDFLGPQNVLSDNACGTVLAVLTVMGAVAAMLAVLLIRVPLRRTLGALFGVVPSGLGFLGAPLLATILFTIGWAGVQYHFPERPGIVADGTFPAVVGLLTYALATYGPRLEGPAASVFDWRDGFDARRRMGVVLLLPVVFSLVATPLLHTPVRDQSTVIVAMLVGYVLLAPRGANPVHEASERAS